MVFFNWTYNKYIFLHIQQTRGTMQNRLSWYFNMNWITTNIKNVISSHCWSGWILSNQILQGSHIFNPPAFSQCFVEALAQGKVWLGLGALDELFYLEGTGAGNLCGGGGSGRRWRAWGRRRGRGGAGAASASAEHSSNGLHILGIKIWHEKKLISDQGNVRVRRRVQLPILPQRHPQWLPSETHTERGIKIYKMFQMGWSLHGSNNQVQIVNPHASQCYITRSIL